MRGASTFILIFHVQVGICGGKKQIHVRKEGLHVQVLKVIEAQHPSSHRMKVPLWNKRSHVVVY